MHTDPTALRLSEPLTLIPLDAILADALPRDRATGDEDAMQSLMSSITATGLRQPIEVWALSAPRDGCTHGLISGMRRLTAFRRIRDLRDGRDHTHIPAFIRTPATVAEAMAAMIAENELRADISPWEKGRILVDAVAEGIFDTLDAAVKGLHPHLSDMARSRLRSIAQVADTLYDDLRSPEVLSQRQLLRIATAIRADFTPLLLTALRESTDKTPERQWRLMEPIVAEAEDWLRNPDPVVRPGRPLRILRPRSGLTVRREKTPEGWSIHFTGPEAHGFLVTSVMEEIERQYR
jgi:ParB family chromosome partitioning protein